MVVVGDDVAGGLDTTAEVVLETGTGCGTVGVGCPFHGPHDRMAVTVTVSVATTVSVTMYLLSKRGVEAASTPKSAAVRTVDRILCRESGV